MTQDNPANLPPTDPAASQAEPADPVPAARKPAAPAAPKRKRKWLRNLLLVVGVFFVLLILLILSIPSLLSSSMVRTRVVDAVNKNLNGNLKIDSWSIGWTSGIRADGIKVFDSTNRQVIEIDHASTQLSLIGAAMGHIHLGQTVLDGLDFDAVRDADGNLNLAMLVKSEPSPSEPSAPKTPASPAAPQAPAPKSKPTKLPAIDGEFQLIHCRGTLSTANRDPVTHQITQSFVKFTVIDGDIKIPNINQPITDSLKIVANTGGAMSGAITVDGSLSLVKDNILITDVDQMNVSETLGITGFDLASVLGFLPPKITTLTGLTDAKFTLALASGQPIALEGSLALKSFKVGGPILKGDVYPADSIVVTVPKTTIDLAAGATDPMKMVTRVRVGDGTAKQPISIVINNTVDGKPVASTITFTADGSPATFMNAAANKPPGGDATVLTSVDFYFAPIARSLPHMLSMVPGIEIKTGRFREDTSVHLSATKTDLTETLRVTEVTAEDTKSKKQIALEPIKLEIKGTDVGGAIGNLPNLRDITIDLKTRAPGANKTPGYATADISLKTLSDLNASLHVSLSDFVREWSQLIDFGTLQLAGSLDVTASVKGDLMNDGKPLKPGQVLTAPLSVTLTGKDLKISGMKDKPPLDEPIVSVVTTATLDRIGEDFVKDIKNLVTTIKTGNLANPTLSVELTGNIELKPNGPGVPSVPDGKVDALAYPPVAFLIQSKVSVNPTLLQQEFGAFLPLAADGLTFRGGTIGADAKVSYDGKSADLNFLFATRELTLEKHDHGAVSNVFDKYRMDVALNGIYSIDKAGMSVIRVPKLVIGDDPTSKQTMLGIQNADDKPIEVTTSADGKMRGSGSIKIIQVNVARLAEIGQAFTPIAPAPTAGASATPTAGTAAAPAAPAAPATPAAPAGRLANGWLKGSIDFSTTDKQELATNVDLDLFDVFYVVPNAKGLNKEEVKVNLSVKAAQNFASILLEKGVITTSVSTTNIANVFVKLKDGPGADAKPVDTVAMLRSATISGTIPSLLDVQQKIDAITPPPAKPAVATASAPRDSHGISKVIGKVKTSAAPPPAPEPPVGLGGGTVQFIVDIQRDATDNLVVSPVMTADNIVLAKGAAKSILGLMDLRGKLTVLTVPPPATAPSAGVVLATATSRPTTARSVMDQIAGIQISPLSFKLSGLDTSIDINGAVDDLIHARKLDGLKIDVNYDAAKLWAFALPLMSADLQKTMKDSKCQGKFTEHFPISGSYPADVDFPKAVANVKASGQIDLALFDGDGITLKNFLVPFALADGKLRLVFADKPEGQNLPNPTELNGGKLSLAGISVDLTNLHMLVDIPDNTKLFDGVGLNALLASNVGDFVNNPLMVGADSAAGQLSITVNKCHALPADTLLTEAVPENQGVLDLNMTMYHLQLGNPAIKDILDKFNANSNSLRGDVNPFHVHIEHGVTTEELTLTFGEKSTRPLLLNGSVAMATQQMNMTLEFPLAMFGVKMPSGIKGVVPQSIKLPLSGPVASPKFDVNKVLEQNFKDSAVGNLLDIFGKKKDKDK